MRRSTPVPISDRTAMVRAGSLAQLVVADGDEHCGIAVHGAPDRMHRSERDVGDAREPPHSEVADQGANSERDRRCAHPRRARCLLLS